MAEFKPKFVKVGDALYLKWEKEEKVEEKQKGEKKTAPVSKEEVKPKIAAEGKHFTWEEEAIFLDFKIRDNQIHTSEISNIADYDVVTFFVNNELDQQIRIRVFMNKAATTIGAVQLSDEKIVEANTQKAWTINSVVDAWLPYLFLQVNCDTPPTNGSLNIKVLKRIPKVEE
jgi:predicted DNA repair protein MutK